MKLAHHKIREFVEPQTFDDVQSFVADPARALAAYRFTDPTAELLAEWLKALAGLPHTHGQMRLLTGPHGVGKSHPQSLALPPVLLRRPTPIRHSASGRACTLTTERSLPAVPAITSSSIHQQPKRKQRPRLPKR